MFKTLKEGAWCAISVIKRASLTHTKQNSDLDSQQNTQTHTHVCAHKHTFKNLFKKKKNEESHFEGLQNGQNSKYHHTLNGNPQKRIRHKKKMRGGGKYSKSHGSIHS